VRGALILVNSLKLSNSRAKIQVYFSLFETVAIVSNLRVFSPLMLFWSLIVLKF